jgi:type I restriction enzyme R subunit
MREMLIHGRHKNLSFFAFTATPKSTTLELFGTEHSDGSFHPFHIYSMRQAIEEGFIMDVLQNYMTYDTCFKIAKTVEENPDVPGSRAAKVIRKFEQLHPYNISQKSRIIVETFLSTTRNKIGGKGKMMVITSSRLAAVRYYHECKRYIEEQGYQDIGLLVAFSGSVNDGGEEYTEPKLNVRKDGSHISESQTKSEFHESFHVLIVAEKYQTGFDEPLLHTMIVDKKLRGVKAVQTLSRLNRIHPEKEDTFILDFVNTREDIQEAFQPFYQETVLEREVNTDLLYQMQNELRGYAIYSDNDVEAFANEYFAFNKQDDRAMGRMTSVLKPVADRYNKLEPDGRYQFRRLCRSFVKWYGYLSQVVRMFDKDMHKEYVFLKYLLGLIPPDPVEQVDLEGKLKLEYYKLQKTFEGNIVLKEGTEPISPANTRSVAQPEKKLPLDEIIDKINEQYNGAFTDADKVMANAMQDRLMADQKLQNIAKTSDPKIFADSIFPKYFETVAQECYLESQDAYGSLFADKAKYNAFMRAMASIIYREMRKTV